MSMPVLPTEKQNNVHELSTMLGIPELRVWKALERSTWDMDRAADMLLSGTDEMPELTVSAPGQGTVAPHELHAKLSGVLNAPHSSPKSRAVIDLTGDDDTDIGKAIRASLETQSAQDPPPYGPAIDDLEWKREHWAVAPRTTNEDRDLSRAVEASLSTNLALGADAYEDLPLKERLRVPGRPVAVRGKSWSVAFIAHIFQAFHHLPQVRELIKAMRFDDAVADIGEADDLQKMQKVLAYLDRGAESYICIDDLIGDNMTFNTQDPGPRTVEILHYIATAIETYSLVSGIPDLGNVLRTSVCDVNQRDYVRTITAIPVRHRHDSLDLMTALAQEMNGSHPWTCFPSLPETFVFHILHDEDGFPSKTEKKTFQYPTTLYPDRFTADNANEAQNRIKKAETHLEAAEGLKARRTALTEQSGRDTRKDLRATLHYFAEVASADGATDRQAEIEGAKAKLSKILARIDNEIDSIDAQVAGLSKASATLFDTEDMQKHRYDLRAVLFHDGLYTPTHVWSYVKDDDGTWWKVHDAHATEVAEASVTSDSTGLHLHAGPYMLFYSRAGGGTATAEPSEWPEAISNYVDAKNYAFETELEDGLSSRGAEAGGSIGEDLMDVS